MKHRILLSLAAALLLAACSAPKAEVPVYVWHMIGNNTPLDSLQKDFQAWKSHGVTGVCIETRSMEQIEQVAALAHREGLEYHAWIPSMLRSGMPHEWYAVNRLGQSADIYPSYANTYRFLDPANPEVKEFLTQQYMTIASIPNVDYVRLDFMRYPDVILASGLESSTACRTWKENTLRQTTATAKTASGSSRSRPVLTSPRWKTLPRYPSGPSSAATR